MRCNVVGESFYINCNWLHLLGGGFGGKKESGQLRFGGRDRNFRKPMSEIDKR